MKLEISYPITCTSIFDRMPEKGSVILKTCQLPEASPLVPLPLVCPGPKTPRRISSPTTQNPGSAPITDNFFLINDLEWAVTISKGNCLSPMFEIEKKCQIYSCIIKDWTIENIILTAIGKITPFSLKVYIVYADMLIYWVLLLEFPMLTKGLFLWSKPHCFGRDGSNECP